MKDFDDIKMYEKKKKISTDELLSLRCGGWRVEMLVSKGAYWPASIVISSYVFRQ
jgi:hypothetical protein